MSNVQILIVPGGFTLPELYDDVISHLKRSPYAALTLHLPSVGHKTEVPGTMQDDAAFIASEVQKYADQGKDVVLVARSYGGLPATESTKGLTKAERQKQGKSGGLVRLAYISCIVLPVGESDPSVIMPDDMLPRAAPFEVELDEDGWLHQTDTSAAVSHVFNDLPREQAERWAELSTRHSAFTMPASLSHAGYKDVPVSYLVCARDLAQEPALQRASIAMMEEQIGAAIDVTDLDCGHAPNASRPRDLADWIATVAKKSI